jgi:hypothetical protein
MSQKLGVFNYMYENRFRVQFLSTRDDLRNLGMTCVVVNLPTIIIGTTPQPTNIRPIHIPGDSMEFEDSNFQFMVQEDLANWRAIVDWIFRLRNPDQACLTRESCDIAVDILDAKHKTIMEATFKDAFPFTVSDVPLTHQIEDVEPSRMDVTFKINGFSYEFLTPEL